MSNILGFTPVKHRMNTPRRLESYLMSPQRSVNRIPFVSGGDRITYERSPLRYHNSPRSPIGSNRNLLTTGFTTQRTELGSKIIRSMTPIPVSPTKKLKYHGSPRRPAISSRSPRKNQTLEDEEQRAYPEVPKRIPGGGALAATPTKVSLEEADRISEYTKLMQISPSNKKSPTLSNKKSPIKKGSGISRYAIRRREPVEPQPPVSKLPAPMKQSTYEQASPLAEQDYAQFRRVPSVDMQRTFIENISNCLYSNHTQADYNAFINDCRGQFHVALDILNKFKYQSDKRRAPIKIQNRTQPPKKVLVLDLDETLIHSEIMQPNQKYDLILEFVNPAQRGVIDVIHSFNSLGNWS